MVIYQLPNGKVVWLTFEQYLDLTDEDIAFLISIDYGESANSPWLGSVLPQNQKNLKFDDIDSEDNDQSLDLPPEDFDAEFDVPDFEDD